jgi:high-affinity nickel-transport protein
MSALLSVVFLGFFLGMRHATDPDHVVAVTTIVSRQRTLRGAVLVGLLWGLGHTVTIVLIGGAIILFEIVIPTRLGLTMELSVALMLILLGVLNLTGILRQVHEALGRASEGSAGHSHPHSHNDYYVHTHPHHHDPEDHGHREEETPPGRLDGRFGGIGVYRLLRPLVVGIVHGLAGSAAIALLVLATIRNPVWATVYLLVFGAGTIAGMMLITGAIAVPVAYSARRFDRLGRVLATASGLVSLAFGLFLAYQIGFVDGLFTVAPHWTPE